MKGIDKRKILLDKSFEARNSHLHLLPPQGSGNGLLQLSDKPRH